MKESGRPAPVKVIFLDNVTAGDVKFVSRIPGKKNFL